MVLLGTVFGVVLSLFLLGISFSGGISFELVSMVSVVCLVWLSLSAVGTVFVPSDMGLVMGGALSRMVIM